MTVRKRVKEKLKQNRKMKTMKNREDGETSDRKVGELIVANISEGKAVEKQDVQFFF